MRGTSVGKEPRPAEVPFSRPIFPGKTERTAPAHGFFGGRAKVFDKRALIRNGFRVSRDPVNEKAPCFPRRFLSPVFFAPGGAFPFGKRKRHGSGAIPDPCLKFFPKKFVPKAGGPPLQAVPAGRPPSSYFPTLILPVHFR
ncbi:hypothetical protein Cdeb_00739 [Caldibacillus debilis GB1]|uniref:Uncharacterized protein n=1 Tax=Caldibacillus debilis GB1 TaxID=1339248 RepID=A0A420VE93_9BACI|nr:hypothetical protein Cdeb_00739 [Caldibacillus debilis GB1]